jgi:hypothetical protein
MPTNSRISFVGVALVGKDIVFRFITVAEGILASS